jgi:hypothetical protein
VQEGWVYDDTYLVRLCLYPGPGTLARCTDDTLVRCKGNAQIHGLGQTNRTEEQCHNSMTGIVAVSIVISTPSSPSSSSSSWFISWRKSLFIRRGDVLPLSSVCYYHRAARDRTIHSSSLLNSSSSTHDSVCRLIRNLHIWHLFNSSTMSACDGQSAQTLRGSTDEYSDDYKVNSK